MKVKKNDTVVVITGKDVKKTGKVLTALPKLNRVVVEGVNIQEKNRKARSAQETSEKIKREGPIDAYNVLVICPQCNKATRVGYILVDGKKVRACKKCGASLDAKVEKKEVAKKTTTKKATTKKTTAQTEEAVTTEAAPKKTRTKKAETAPAVEEVKEVKKTSTRKKAVKEEKTENAEA